MPEDGGAGNGKASVPVKEERPKSPHRPAAAKSHTPRHVPPPPKVKPAAASVAGGDDVHNMVQSLKRMGFKVEAPSPAVSSAGSSLKAPSPPEGKSPQPASPPQKKPKTNDVLMGPTAWTANASR